MGNMWYDQYQGIPPSGSALESLLLYVCIDRRQSELLANRALVQSIIPLHEGKVDAAIEAYQRYFDAVYPFIGRAGDHEKEDARKRLLELVKHPLRIPLRPIWRAKAEKAKRLASIKQFQLKPRYPGT